MANIVSLRKGSVMKWGRITENFLLHILLCSLNEFFYILTRQFFSLVWIMEVTVELGKR